MFIYLTKGNVAQRLYNFLLARIQLFRRFIAKLKENSKAMCLQKINILLSNKCAIRKFMISFSEKFSFLEQWK